MGVSQTTEQPTCSSMQMSLSTQREVGFCLAQAQGWISCEQFPTTIWRRLQRDLFTSGETDHRLIPTQHSGSPGLWLSQRDCPTSISEGEDMKSVPYAPAVGSLMYAMVTT